MDEDLRYSATNRCPCGAGLAYPKNINTSYGENAYWDCSDILKDIAIQSGMEGSQDHTARLPFVFYEIRSEDQNKSEICSTRPN